MNTPYGPIYESNAIAYYIAASQPNAPLLGSNPYEQALVQQYLHVADGEISPAVSTLVYPIVCPKHAITDKSILQKANQDVCNVLSVLNQILLNKTFLVGESITLADIVTVCSLYWPFTLILDLESRKPFNNVVRWFTTCVEQPQFKAVLGETKLCSQIATSESYQSEMSKKSDCATASCKINSTVTEDHEESYEESKPKNPLDALPSGRFVMDTWKRFYSNNETSDSIKYFWENYDTSCYSMHRFVYKYNDELTKVFMSSNLIGGFYQRLEEMRKHLFGNMAVFGEDNDSIIAGMFIVRGSEIPECMKQVPDIDSYEITTVDISNSNDRREWECFLAWKGEFQEKKLNVAKTFK